LNTVGRARASGESLKVIKREPDLWRVRVADIDDLWTLGHLCQKGRLLGMLGERRDQTTAGQEGGRAKAAERKRMWIVLRIESHENHAFSDVLRVHGIIEEAPIDKGSHHTHMISVGDEVEIRAESFPQTDLDLLQRSAKETGKGRLAIAVVEHDEVNLFEVATHGIREVAQFTLRGGGKYTGGSKASQEVQDSFRSKVAGDIDMQLAEEMPLLLCGPGLARDKMLAELQDSGRELKSVATSIGGRPGANEVLSSGLAGEFLEQHGLVHEMQLLGECWRRIATDEPVAYGEESLAKAMSEGAIETLLISAETLRSDATIEGKSWSEWCKGLSDIGAKLVQCSTEHDDGQQLIHFGGAVALLRFNI
jgi:protein pelota